MQFLAFLALASGCFLLNFAINQFFFSELSGVLLNKDTVITENMSTQFKAAQFFGALISFVLPALLFGYFSSPKALPYIGIQKHMSPLLLGISILLLLSVIPFVGWLSIVNTNLKFGSFHAGLKKAEEGYTENPGGFS